jgi:hypothetical protein
MTNWKRMLENALTEAEATRARTRIIKKLKLRKATPLS